MNGLFGGRNATVLSGSGRSNPEIYEFIETFLTPRQTRKTISPDGLLNVLSRRLRGAATGHFLPATPDVGAAFIFPGSVLMLPDRSRSILSRGAIKYSDKERQVWLRLDMCSAMARLLKGHRGRAPIPTLSPPGQRELPAMSADGFTSLPTTSAAPALT